MTGARHLLPEENEDYALHVTDLINLTESGGSPTEAREILAATVFLAFLHDEDLDWPGAMLTTPACRVDYYRHEAETRYDISAELHDYFDWRRYADDMSADVEQLAYDAGPGIDPMFNGRWYVVKKF